MKRTITVLLAILVAVGMLASFAGPAAAQNPDDSDREIPVHDKNTGSEVNTEGIQMFLDTTVCTIEAPDSAETSLCEPESPDDGATIQ